MTFACTICGQPSFARLRVEIDLGAATYFVCLESPCITEACQRAADNLWNASKKARAGPSAITAESKDA